MFVEEDCLPGHLSHVVLLRHHEDVLGLDVGVDYFAFGVEIVKAFEHLLHDEFDVVQRDTLVV